MWKTYMPSISFFGGKSSSKRLSVSSGGLPGPILLKSSRSAMSMIVGYTMRLVISISRESEPEMILITSPI